MSDVISSTLRGSLGALLFALGGVVLLALALLATRSGSDAELRLLASAQAGGEVRILEASGPVDVYVSGARSVGPEACTVSAPGGARVASGPGTDTTLDQTTLYAVGRLEDFAPPGSLQCSGDGVEHVYAATGGDAGGGTGWRTVSLAALGLAGLGAAAYLVLTGRRP